MALRLQPCLVHQYARIGIEAGESETYVVVDHRDFAGCDARVLELHRRPLLAAEHDNGGALDGDSASPALDGFECIFDLEDVAIGGEDCRESETS